MINIRYTQKPKTKKVSFSQKEVPAFAAYTPDIAKIKSFGKNFLKYENIIIVARGGSITSFRAYFEALAGFEKNKKVYFVDTADPDYLLHVKKSCPRNKTVLIVISKSGTTVDVIENYLYLPGYKTIFITTENNNTMYKIARKKRIPILSHPEIGGRYSGLTLVALLPAFLVGIDIGKLLKGARRAYKDFSPKNVSNKAKRLAEYLNYFDRKGYVEIYMPIYSAQLQGFSELIMQLIHESVGKNDKGLTIIPVSAPECQHHSNQRYYGGRKNMQGLFLIINNFQNKDYFKVPSNIKDIILRNKSLGKLNSLKLKDAMRAEFVGNWKDSIKRKVPASMISLDKVDEENVGYLVGFFHYLTVYLSWLNRVNPFDQPEVDSSKEISFRNRFLKG